MEFERLTDKNKVLIGKVLVNAYFNNYEVWFANYQKEDRKDGTPDYEEIIMEDVLSVLDLEEYKQDEFTDNDYKELATLLKTDFAPEFNSGGCNDLRIKNKDEQEYYYIWYFDHRENRIYTDDIYKFLNSLNIQDNFVDCIFSYTTDIEQFALDEIKLQVEQSGLNIANIQIYDETRACRNASGKELLEDEFDSIDADNDDAWFDDYDYIVEARIYSKTKNKKEIISILEDKVHEFIDTKENYEEEE